LFPKQSATTYPEGDTFGEFFGGLSVGGFEDVFYFAFGQLLFKTEKGVPEQLLVSKA